MTPDAITELLLVHAVYWGDLDVAWCNECAKYFDTEREWADHVSQLIAVGFAH